MKIKTRTNSIRVTAAIPLLLFVLLGSVPASAAGYLAAWGRNSNGQCNVPAGNNYSAISAGYSHSVALKSDGSLVAWGDNGVGQCNVPSGIVVAVSAGYGHNVAIRSDGSLAPWGENGYGQCNVPSGTDYVAVAGGGNHSLALKSDSSLAAWGWNDYGQCDVPAGNNYSALAAGGYHSLALKSDGSIAAWGRNDFGQCDVPAGNNYVAIAAGLCHSVALKSDGSLVAWGYNSNGECDVPAGNNYTAVSAGWAHSVALKADRSLVAWGDNLFNQCNVPVGNNYVAIAAGSDHNLAIVDDVQPTVTINQSSGQSDPTSSGPINFTVVFSEVVADFAAGDVTLSGTAGATTATVTGSGTTYNVAVSGMTSGGTVIASIAAGAASDAAGNPSLASTSTDNTVTYLAVAPVNVSLSPSGGAVGVSITTFHCRYSDLNGYADIKRVYLLINDSWSQSNAALMMYDRSANRVYLKNDANTSWGTGYVPGKAGSLVNSQCTLYPFDTTAHGSGNDVTVNWSIGLKKTFATKLLKAYMYVQDAGGLTDGWDQMGLYHNLGPQTVSIDPDSGPLPIDRQTTLTSVYRDPNGAADMAKCYVLICEGFSQVNAAFIFYDKTSNKVYLKNDANTSWGTGYVPGTNVALENSQCVVYVKDITVAGVGNDLTINWAFKLKPSMTDKSLFSWMYVADSKGLLSGWKKMGTHFTPVAPVCLSVAPSSGNVTAGIETGFAAVYEDENGWPDIYKVYLQLSVTSSQANAVLVMYDAKLNKVFLKNDANTSWGVGQTPGAAVVLENSQCKVNLASMGPPPWSVTDKQLQVWWPIEIKAGQVGKKLCVRMFAQDNESMSSGWKVKGYVSVVAPSPGVRSYTVNGVNISHNVGDEGVYYDTPATQAAYNTQIIRTPDKYYTVFHGEPNKPVGMGYPGDSVKTAYQTGTFTYTMPGNIGYRLYGHPTDTLSILYSPEEHGLNGWGGTGNPMVVKGRTGDNYYYAFFIAVTDDDRDRDLSEPDFRHYLCQARSFDMIDWELRTEIDGVITWKPFNSGVPMEWRRARTIQDVNGNTIMSQVGTAMPDTFGLIGSICYYNSTYYFFYTDPAPDGRTYLYVRTCADVTGNNVWSAAQLVAGNLMDRTTARVAKAHGMDRWAVLYNGYKVGNTQELMLQYTANMNVAGAGGISDLTFYNSFFLPEVYGYAYGLSDKYMGLASNGNGSFGQHYFMTDEYGNLTSPDGEAQNHTRGGIVTWTAFTSSVFGDDVYRAGWDVSL